MNNKKKFIKIAGFSFVELIIVISIIALISVIWISINNNYTEKSKNTKITSDIQTLQNSLESYKSETKTLPDPKWNQKFFDDSSNYVHYDDTTVYWVAGFITENTIPKKYLWYLPVDPRTNQYYAYGKTMTWAIEFEIAGINVVNGTYESRVVWDHTWESGPYNLIREYNWPDFVYDKSKNNFPYNPDERIIKWKIGSFSGIVTVNTKTVDNNWIAKNELKTGDTIEVSTWSEAQIYYSDWSKSYLWDTSKASKLTLANMVYKDENNLFTKIQLALDYGTIWTKTSKLDPNSEFEIYTTDTEAAVRGTIFGVSNSGTLWSTKISVKIGKVKITKIENPSPTIGDIIDKLENNEDIMVSSTISGTVLANSTVSVWATILTASYIPPLLPDGDWITNIQPKIISIIPWWTVVLGLPISFSGANMRIISWVNEITSSWTRDHHILTMTWLTGTQEIKICGPLLIKCTKSVSIATNLGYSSTCKLWKLDFWPAVWCVEQDASLVASWYTLVAYAPYDVAGDLKMYKRGWSSLNMELNGITGSLADNSSENFPIWCDTKTSFCDIDWVKWVFIWTWTAIADYIKYTNIWDLNLWSNFAVEMSVRGEALKRTTWTFNMFNSDNYFLKMANFTSEKLQLSEYISFIFQNRIKENINIWLVDSNYYKILFKKDWQNWNLYIDWTWYNYSTWILDISKNLWSYIYIWSNNWSTPTNQWNSIINYIKVYKKQ